MNIFSSELGVGILKKLGFAEKALVGEGSLFGVVFRPMYGLSEDDSATVEKARTAICKLSGGCTA